MDATTIGAVSIFDEAWCDAPTMLRHERQHTYQAMCLGVFFIPAYYLASAWSHIRGSDAYMGNWFEIQAYATTEELDG